MAQLPTIRPAIFASRIAGDSAECGFLLSAWLIWAHGCRLAGAVLYERIVSLTAALQGSRSPRVLVQQPIIQASLPPSAGSKPTMLELLLVWFIIASRSRRDPMGSATCYRSRRCPHCHRPSAHCRFRHCYRFRQSCRRPRRRCSGARRGSPPSTRLATAHRCESVFCKSC